MAASRCTWRPRATSPCTSTAYRGGSARASASIPRTRTSIRRTSSRQRSKRQASAACACGRTTRATSPCTTPPERRAARRRTARRCVTDRPRGRRVASPYRPTMRHGPAAAAARRERRTAEDALLTARGGQHGDDFLLAVDYLGHEALAVEVAILVERHVHQHTGILLRR